MTDAAVPMNCNTLFQFKQSCYDKLHSSFSDSLGIIGGAGLAIGMIELISLILSAVLFNKIAAKEKASGSLVGEAWRINKNKVSYGYQNYQYL